MSVAIFEWLCFGRLLFAFFFRLALFFGKDSYTLGFCAAVLSARVPGRRDTEIVSHL
jgi:hypothetical protein